APGALQEEVGAFATRELALGSGIACHGILLISVHGGCTLSGQPAVRYIRRRLGGRQPLCGTGVTSAIETILRPRALSARTADSRPGPGPLMRTSRFFTPCSWAARPADSAATWAANGVDLRDPLKPAAPEVAHDRALPWRSVIVMIVLLKDACTCAIPSETTFFAFLRTRAAAGALAMFGVPYLVKR